MALCPAPSSSVPADTNIQYKTSQKMFVYLHTAAETLYEAPQGLSQRSKHFIISLIMIFECKTLQKNFPFTLANNSPFCLCQHSVYFFPCLSNRILSVFPSVSLSIGFSSWFSAIVSFGQFSSLCYHSPSFPFIHFKSKHSNVLFLWCSL